MLGLVEEKAGRAKALAAQIAPLGVSGAHGHAAIRTQLIGRTGAGRPERIL